MKSISNLFAVVVFASSCVATCQIFESPKSWAAETNTPTHRGSTDRKDDTSPQTYISFNYGGPDSGTR
ncbi:MAG: hypothetical protein RMY28_009270 [Nostoc sp. ChiSLP01]|nr:hypothetical protein [Nostoc sp. CmiSLP01]MDZ8285253.1 hypothetical protein [Nostoc sp. ChiSLP01]